MELHCWLNALPNFQLSENYVAGFAALLSTLLIYELNVLCTDSSVTSIIFLLFVFSAF